MSEETKAEGNRQERRAAEKAKVRHREAVELDNGMSYQVRDYGDTIRFTLPPPNSGGKAVVKDLTLVMPLDDFLDLINAASKFNDGEEDVDVGEMLTVLNTMVTDDFREKFGKVDAKYAVQALLVWADASTDRLGKV